MRQNKQFFQLNLHEKFTDIIGVSILAGIFGGRFIEVISDGASYPHWQDWFAIWQGGFSALGSIIGVSIIVPLYLRYNNCSILPLFDLAAIYAPLFQAIARFGCLTAGCCHGIATNSIFSVIYTNSETIAQCGIPVHPTQLYSSIILFCVFLFMFFIAQNRLQKPGQLFTLYLMLASSERFIMDFLRADRIMLNDSWLSFHQLIAIIIFNTALAIFITISLSKNKKQLSLN